MSQQLALFKEEEKRRYKKHYDSFYKGVKERYESERRERLRSSDEMIMINNLIPKTYE